MNQLYRRVIQLGVLLLVLPTLLSAQDAALKRVPYKIECPTCRIEFTTIAIVGKASDPVSISPRATKIVRDSKGRFFAFSDEIQLAMYDSKGDFVQAVGRKGDGPGEFNPNPLNVPNLNIGNGDTLFVFDRGRITVYSPELKYVRTIATTAITNVGGAEALPNGNWMLHGQFRSPQGIGYSAHVMDSKGSIIRSIGPEEKVIPGVPMIARSFLSSPDGKSVWFYDLEGFWMQQWSVAGAQMTSLQIANAPYMLGQYGGAVYMLGVDSAGRLWFTGTERDPPRPRGARGAPPPRQVPRTVTLDILDPRTGTVVVSQKLEHGFRLFPSGTAAYTVKEDANGFKSFHIMSFHIVGM